MVLLEVSEDAGHLVPARHPPGVVLVAPHLPGVQILSEDAVLELLDLLQDVSVRGVAELGGGGAGGQGAVAQLYPALVPLQPGAVNLNIMMYLSTDRDELL